jgi:hypothetical protein
MRARVRPRLVSHVPADREQTPLAVRRRAASAFQQLYSTRKHEAALRLLIPTGAFLDTRRSGKLRRPNARRLEDMTGKLVLQVRGVDEQGFVLREQLQTLRLPPELPEHRNRAPASAPRVVVDEIWPAESSRARRDCGALECLRPADTDAVGAVQVKDTWGNAQFLLLDRWVTSRG